MKTLDEEKLSRYARIMLLGFLVLLIYDGALRKWFFQGGERFIFILKDGMIVASLALALLVHYKKRLIHFPKLVWIPFAAYMIYVVLEAFNPKLPNFWVALWGIKSHLLYGSLILIVPAVSGGLRQLFDGLGSVFPWLVVPVCLIAMVQNYSPEYGLINIAVRGNDEMSWPLTNNRVRSSGTFSFITGFTWFLQAAILTGLFMLVRQQKSSCTLIVSLLFLFIALPTNGSRSVIIIVAVTIVMMLASFILAKQLDRSVFLKYVAMLGVFITISYVVIDNAWAGLIDRFLYSYLTPGDSARYYTAFTNAFEFFELAGWFGFGTGSTSQAAPFLVGSVERHSWLPAVIRGYGFEEESGRLVIELGIFGWIISLAFRLSIFACALFMVLKGRTAESRGAAILALPTMALGIYVGSGIFAPPIGAAFYWFCVALLVMAWNESRQARFSSNHVKQT